MEKSLFQRAIGEGKTKDIIPIAMMENASNNLVYGRLDNFTSVEHEDIEILKEPPIILVSGKNYDSHRIPKKIRNLDFLEFPLKANALLLGRRVLLKRFCRSNKEMFPAFYCILNLNQKRENKLSEGRGRIHIY